MQVLLTSEVFLPRISGLVTAVRNLAEALVDAGDDVTLACPGSPQAQRWARDAGVSLLPTRRARIRPDLNLAVPRLKSLRKRLCAIDVVHVHSPATIGLPAILAAHRSGIPVVGSLHILPGNLFGPFGLSAEKFPVLASTTMALIARGLSRVDAVISPSQYGAQLLREQLPGCAVNVISNGVRIEAGTAFQQGRSLPSEAPLRALYVGRLQREKRVEELIAGLSATRLLGVDSTLTIVGGGPDEARLRQLVDARRLAAHVKFTGVLPADALDQARRRADVFCIASRSELQCCAALEAMAAGLPVVAARYGALPETVPDGIVGRLYEPGDINGFARALCDLTIDPDEYRKCSAAAMRHAGDHALESIALEMQSLYREVAHLRADHGGSSA